MNIKIIIFSLVLAFYLSVTEGAPFAKTTTPFPTPPTTRKTTPPTPPPTPRTTAPTPPKTTTPSAKTISRFG